MPFLNKLTRVCILAKGPDRQVIPRKRSDREILDSSTPLRSGSEWLQLLYQGAFTGAKNYIPRLGLY